MIGSFLNRGLILIFGYAYPAYDCYKSVELNKPNIELLRFWCQYWILVAFITVLELFGDIIIGWLPMYGEAKLAFFIYLWYPKTQGTSYVYNSFFRPFIAKHEKEIDRRLLELKARAGDFIFMYWQNSAGYVQTRVLEVLKFAVTQSTNPKAGSAQNQVDDKHKSEGTSSEESNNHKAAPMPVVGSSAETSSEVVKSTGVSKDENGPFTRARLRKVNSNAP